MLWIELILVVAITLIIWVMIDIKKLDAEIDKEHLNIERVEREVEKLRKERENR